MGDSVWAGAPIEPAFAGAHNSAPHPWHRALREPENQLARREETASNQPFAAISDRPSGGLAKFLLAFARRSAYLMWTFRPFFFGPAPAMRRTADKKSSKT
jgi:hypothetical protein